MFWDVLAKESTHEVSGIPMTAMERIHAAIISQNHQSLFNMSKVLSLIGNALINLALRHPPEAFCNKCLAQDRHNSLISTILRYFFVPKKNVALAKTIEKSLNKSIESGSFDTFYSMSSRPFSEQMVLNRSRLNYVFVTVLRVFFNGSIKPCVWLKL